jgi:hypothetical protein
MLSRGDIKNQLESLNNYDATDGLPEWESNFIASVMGQMESQNWDTLKLSSKQIDKIEELYNRRIEKSDDRRFHDTRNNKY